MSIVLTDNQAKAYIAQNIMRVLEERGMTRRELSRAVGESEPRISYVTRGLKMPSAAFLARIAEALSVTVDELLTPPEQKATKSPV